MFVFIILSQTYTFAQTSEDLNLCEIKCCFTEYCIQINYRNMIGHLNTVEINVKFLNGFIHVFVKCVFLPCDA